MLLGALQMKRKKKENLESGLLHYMHQVTCLLWSMRTIDQLREQMYMAYMSKAFKGGERDNQEIILKLVKLRAEKAELLGYETYASYVLEERMAEHPDKVIAFLEDLLDRSLPKAKEEVEELKAFMCELGETHELQRWDWAYYSEKLKKKKFELDDELTQTLFQAGKRNRWGVLDCRKAIRYKI